MDGRRLETVQDRQVEACGRSRNWTRICSRHGTGCTRTSRFRHRPGLTGRILDIECNIGTSVKVANERGWLATA